MKKIIVLLLLSVSLTISSNEASLQFYGIKPSKLKSMGCPCTRQAEIDDFVSNYYRQVARTFKDKYGYPVGVIQSGARSASGFSGSFSEDLTNWIPSSDVVNYERPVILVGWPEHGANN